jgi:thiol-disulfide isomerase/thioredoxin
MGALSNGDGWAVASSPAMADEPDDHPDDAVVTPKRRFGLDRRTLVLCASVAAVAAVVAFVIAYAVFSSDGDGEKGGLTAATKVPSEPFTRPDGSTTSLAAYRGKKLVVNFFASSCIPCKKEMPALEKEHRRDGDKVTFVGLAVQDDHAQAAALVKRSGVTYDTGLDDSGTLIQKAGGGLLPYTIFVDADGTILDHHYGAMDATTLRQKVSGSLLAGG